MGAEFTTLKIILSISGSLIVLLLAIIGYFLQQQIEASKALTKAVNALNVSFSVLQSQQEERHPIIERRLNAHAERLDRHDKQLVKIETTLKINQHQEA